MIDQVVELQHQGMTRGQIASAMGISFNRVKYLLELSRKPDGIKQALHNTKLEGSKPAFGWRKIKNKDGTSDSVFWKATEEAEAVEDIADRIADRMNKVVAAPYIMVPASPRDDLVNFIPLFDVHLSMRTSSFGIQEAVKRLQYGFSDILSRAPSAKECLIVNGGDFTHQNDDSNQTPRSKHPLPVDADYLTTTDVAVDVTVDMVEKALLKHDRVVFKAVRGNHDENTPYIIRAALRQRYRNCDRVEIQVDDLDFFAHQAGRNLICAHHGDLKKNPKDMVLGFAARYPEMWGSSLYRELHTGHQHHMKAIDMPGMLYEQHRAITPQDEHSKKNLYDAPSEMQAITYKLEGGRYGTVTHAF